MKFQLVISDVDSTLIEQEVIDLLAASSGLKEEVSSITARAMAGEIEFKAALLQRVALLEGLPSSVLEDVTKEISFSPGASELREYCRSNGIKFGAVTGGFLQVLSQMEFFRDLDYLAGNSLEIIEGKLTGRVKEPIVDRHSKAEHLKRFAAESGVTLDQTVAIGDGANDLLMIQSAGFGIAFRAKKVLRDAADLTVEDDLREVLSVLTD